jgi:hypothetical protein
MLELSVSGCNSYEYKAGMSVGSSLELLNARAFTINKLSSFLELSFLAESGSPEPLLQTDLVRARNQLAQAMMHVGVTINLDMPPILEKIE